MAGNAAASERAALPLDGQESWYIVTGLVVLALATALFAAAVWKSGTLARWSGVPLAVAFALYVVANAGALAHDRAPK